MDPEGHVKLTDFGLARQGTSQGELDIVAGSAYYVAPGTSPIPTPNFPTLSLDHPLPIYFHLPGTHARTRARTHTHTCDSALTLICLAWAEVLLMKGHTFTADWWSLGILIHEMLTGLPPFYSHEGDTGGAYKKLLSQEIEYPEGSGISTNARELIKGLVQASPSERLRIHSSESVGDQAQGGSGCLKSQPWWQLDWNQVRRTHWSFLESRLCPCFPTGVPVPISLEYPGCSLQCARIFDVPDGMIIIPALVCNDQQLRLR
jgi:serine/threonine protein kinase